MARFSFSRQTNIILHLLTTLPHLILATGPESKDARLLPQTPFYNPQDWPRTYKWGPTAKDDFEFNGGCLEFPVEDGYSIFSPGGPKPNASLPWTYFCWLPDRRPADNNPHLYVKTTQNCYGLINTLNEFDGQYPNDTDIVRQLPYCGDYRPFETWWYNSSLWDATLPGDSENYRLKCFECASTECEYVHIPVGVMDFAYCGVNGTSYGGDNRWLRSAHNIEPWGKCYFPITAMNELYADGNKPLLRPENTMPGAGGPCPDWDQPPPIPGST